MNWRYLAGAFALMFSLAACGEDPVLGDGGNTTPTCGADDTLCGLSCVDLDADSRNCGACGTACGEGEVCSSGACSVGCPATQTACEGGCFDTGTSSTHCGACGTTCGEGEACAAGLCVAACPDGQVGCDGGCYDLQASAAHCGACGTSCAVGELCVAGGCATSCPAEQVACDGACFDTQTSNANCGTCGNSCGDGESCSDGVCTLACAAGLDACDGSCVTLQSDRSNCGACGTSCGDDELCIDGACTLSCAPDVTDCDGACRDTQVDRNNCGGCGTVCDDEEICSDGVCAPSCGTWANDICDDRCTNTNMDPRNCGACGTTCAAGQVCSEGACTDTCAEGADVCGGSCTSLQHDPANCGACGETCSATTNAGAVCGAGGCGNVCLPGYGDCDLDLESSNSNGCESSFADSVSSCGACGVICPSPTNATADCTAGACGIGQCQGGWLNCDGASANGCEIDGSRDATNCGACGATCTGSEECLAGACTPTGAADVCASAHPLIGGLNQVFWEARNLDYLTAAPSCDTSAPKGGDFVMEYTAPITGAVKVTIDKPASSRWHLVVTNNPCGDVAEDLRCVSDYTNSGLETTFPVVTGETYYLYMVRGTLITYTLANPVDVVVMEYPSGSAGAGEVCSTAVPLLDGPNSVQWNADINDYFDEVPSCWASKAQVAGPDIVMKYSPTYTGAVEMILDRASGKQAFLAVTEGNCGSLSNEHACAAKSGVGTSMDLVFPVTAGTDYYVHMIAGRSGSSSTNLPLPGPLGVQVNPIDCSGLTPTVLSVSPEDGTAAASLAPAFTMSLSHPAKRDAGTITVTGTLGSAHTFTLPSDNVTFSADNKTITIAPPGFLRSDELVTVAVTGLQNLDCSTVFPTTQWTVTMPTRACSPGTNGMNGGVTTRVPMNATGTMFSEYNVAVDSDPAGWVYLGGDTQLLRMPKAGGDFQNIGGTAGLAAKHLGHTMLIDGPNIYTVESKATGTAEHLWRISSDGGATWALQDVGVFGTSATDDPEDKFRGVTKYDGRIYLITHETTATTATQIWSLDPSGTLPAPARIETSFGGNYTSCSGLTMDATSYFTTCRQGTTSTYAVLRISRTGLVTEITTAFPGNTTVMTLHAQDRDADGTADYLYFQEDVEEGYFICGPYDAAPYTDKLFSFGTGSGNYGMGFDPSSSTLWAYDDDTYEFVKIQ